AGHGSVAREKAGIEHLPRELRPFLRRLGVTFGALDVFAPALLKPAARGALHAAGIDRRPLAPAMPSVLAGRSGLPTGYRLAGPQAIRVDLAEKLVRAAHEARTRAGARQFALDPALALSTGLTRESWERVLAAAGFRVSRARALPKEALGPPAPDRWSWRPARPARQPEAVRPQAAGAFAALADLTGR
ncbi:MAG TPA: helicase, partial [Allosphingosinicella sp.]